MGPGEHRPHDHEYWTEPWSTTLFAGDLFEAIPFGEQPIVVYTGEDEPVAGKHFVGEVAFGYGLLITPTCDMTDQHGGGSAHPYRVLVPVLPLSFVAEQTVAIAENEKLLRSRDTIHPYMYLPPLDDVLSEESVACLFRPSLVSDELLANPPRRVAQLHADSVLIVLRHLQVSSRRRLKLAAYWARVAVDPAELALTGASPPSQYDRE